MIDGTDLVVGRAFENSSIVRAIERIAGAMKAAASTSRVVTTGRSWLRASTSRPGQVLLSAVVAHSVLMLSVARPISWQWLVLPSIAAAIGIVLIVFSRPPRMEQ